MRRFGQQAQPLSPPPAKWSGAPADGAADKPAWVGEGSTASGAAEEAAVSEAARLVAGADQLLSCAGGPAGPKCGPTSVDCARPGSKHHVVVDGRAAPLTVSLTGGSRHPAPALVEQSPRGGRRRRAAMHTAGHAFSPILGYDHDEYRRLLWKRGMARDRRARAAPRFRPGHLPLGA